MVVGKSVSIVILKTKEIEKNNKKMKLRVEKFLQFELKIGVMVLISFLIFINLAIVIYGELHTFHRSDSRFLRIVLSFGKLTLNIFNAQPLICVQTVQIFYKKIQTKKTKKKTTRDFLSLYVLQQLSAPFM